MNKKKNYHEESEEERVNFEETIFEDNLDVPEVENPEFDFPISEFYQPIIYDPIIPKIQEPIKLKAYDLPLLFNSPKKHPPRQQNATPKQVAAWMKDQIIDGKYLYPSHISYEIEDEFGDTFTYQNKNGNRAIIKDVLDEFRKITPEYVWCKSEFYWRLREKGDEPGRRQVP